MKATRNNKDKEVEEEGASSNKYEAGHGDNSLISGLYKGSLFIY